MTGLAQLLQGGEADRGGRVYGVVTGVVTNNQDPDGLARVKVRFPWLSGQDESWWARVAAPMAGPDAGVYFLPDVNDEVLVAFEQGDVRFPYVLGALWHAGDAPAEPPDDNADGKNAVRMLRSRAGLTVTLDDAQGAERIVIADGAEKTTITVDAANEKIVIDAGSGVTVSAQGGSVTVEGPEVTVRASSGKLSLEGTSVEVKSQGGLKLEASAQVDIKGAMINVG